MLNKSFLKKMKERLITEKNNLINVELSQADIDVSGDETDEIQGSILINLQNQLLVRNKAKLNQINDALQRIENNVYGLCQDCESEIPEKRLLVNPYFLNCVGCAEDREAEEKQRKRI